tara:strand:+ start:997 stop:1779 length:783 start_codon:yes stop_codon:yes gene_type:complete
MFKFKKRKKQELVWDFIPTRPSNVTFEAKGGKSLDDYLVPLVTTMPPWFKSLKQTKDYLKQFPNVRTCPSFVELFKNSYAFTAPCDLQLKVSKQSMDIIQPEDGWVSITSHTALPPELGGTQMGDMWDKSLQNIKIMSGLQIGVNTGECNIMHIPAYYHNPRAVYFAPPGISTLTADNPLDLNLNLFIDMNRVDMERGETIHIKHGTVLAYIYMPSGILPHTKVSLDKKMRKSFLGDYQRQLEDFRNKESKGKCPFPFLH